MSAIGSIFYGREMVLKASMITGLPVNRIVGERREKDLCETRFAIWKAMRDHGASLPQIGRRFNRDHTTIINGLKRAETLMSNPYFAQFVKDIAG